MWSEAHRRADHGAEIAHDLIHAFVHVDRSVLSLIRQLLVLPGAVARNFIKRAATPVGVRAIP